MFIPSQRNLWKPYILRPKNLFKLAVFLLIVKVLFFSWICYFPRTANFADITSVELITMANQDRIANGLEPLSLNPQLVEAAQKKALDMLNQNYFAHTSPIGINPWYWLEKVGYKYSAAGENLAKDFVESEYVHDAWMDSSSHKANILNSKYQDIGVAVVEGDMNGKKTIVVVEFFGKGYAVKTAKPIVPAKVVINEATKNENKVEVPATTPDVRGEEILRGPEVFKQKEISDIIGKTDTVVGIIAEKSETWTQKIYLAVLAIIGLVLMLSIFINIKVQYPRMILLVLVFIILAAAIILFNGGALLNRGLEII